MRGALEIALPEAFRQCTERKRRGVVILGDPGAGKTTHLKRLLLSCLRKGAASVELPEDMLPVFLPLRDLRDLKHGLDKFIQDQLDSPHLNTPAGFGRAPLEAGQPALSSGRPGRGGGPRPTEAGGRVDRQGPAVPPHLLVRGDQPLRGIHPGCASGRGFSGDAHPAVERRAGGGFRSQLVPHRRARACQGPASKPRVSPERKPSS